MLFLEVSAALLLQLTVSKPEAPGLWEQTQNQGKEVGVTFLLTRLGWESHSGCQVWWQAPYLLGPLTNSSNKSKLRCTT